MNARFLLGTSLLAALVVIVLAAPALAEGPLRYKLKAGAAHVYKVEIRADRGDEIAIHSGHPEFKVQSLDAGNAKVLLSNPRLGERSELKPGVARGFGPPRFPSMRFPRSPFEFTGHELTLNDRGQVVSERGQSQVTYMLGNLANLIFESFPEEAKPAWSLTEKEIISVTAASRGPFRDDTEKERLNAEQTTDYTVKETVGNKVAIERKVALKTVEKAGDGPKLELSLVGIYTFDKTAGLPLSIAYDGQIIAREANTTTRVPLTVRIDLLTEEELVKLRAEQAQAAAEMKARQEAAAAERKKPLADAERAEILANLTGGDKNKIKDALRKLKDKDPPQPDAEIGRQIAPQLIHEDIFVRQYSAEALEKWGTLAEVPALAVALSDKHLFTVHAALRALGRLQDPTVAPLLTGKMAEAGTRSQAAAALKAMGPAAEKDVLVLLGDPEWIIRMEACNILADIGTDLSAKQLTTAAASDENGIVKLKAKQALDAITKRGKP
ncbi:MAG: HEAT repeat domain-containing protein [Pirellulaceae bacterium]|nr:HEAT repeat domain-containing protein [Pirellulaceae bacterium]